MRWMQNWHNEPVETQHAASLLIVASQMAAKLPDIERIASPPTGGSQ